MQHNHLIMSKNPQITTGFVKIDNLNDPTDFKPSDFNLNEFPVLPTRNLVLFPGVVSPVRIGREKSLATVKLAEEMHRPVAIVCQSDPENEDPTIDQLFKYGVIAHIIKVFELPDGSTTALVSATVKCEILGEAASSNSSFPLNASIKVVKDRIPRAKSTTEELATYASEIKNLTLKLSETSGDNDSAIDITMNLRNAISDEDTVNMVATHFPGSTQFKLELLSESSLLSRAKNLLTELVKHDEMMKMARKVHESAKESFDDQQRRAFLQRQMEAIDRELNGDDSEAEQLAARAESVPMPDNVRETFNKELSKLNRHNPQSPEYSVQFSYLESLLDLPWGKFSQLETTLPQAAQTLDSYHYGLDKVKERIIEQVALLINNPDGKSPIICLVGPPGVGKTSLGKSIAEALGRSFQRISLGGLHDEAEIRGHRRTYIGAMPGRIIDAVKRAGTCNPVLMLDEVDKIGKDYKGDPEAALLEVLDPEQNFRFHDNYIDIDFDLSKVLFIATANNVSNLSRPLLDRMEVIDISGYVIEEKVEIAVRHLIPTILNDLSLQPDDFNITNEAIGALIEGYTAESGVRQLEKELRSIVRKIIVRKLKGESYPNPITPGDLKSLLGAERYNRERYSDNRYAGVVTGLAWTAAGGEILFIESSISSGKGDKLTLTGNLGDVMKESAMIALQYIRAHASQLGVDSSLLENSNIHIHVPEGAIPKDGPSAGITMATSILSALKGMKVRYGLAMTGEMTLRGKVLPVGGIKEKMLAARRAGITDIILSEENRKDVDEIDDRYKKDLNFHFVNDISQVFDFAITDEPA